MNSIKTKLIIAISLILSIFIIGIMSFALMFKPYYINIKLDEMNLVTTKLENLLSYNDLEKVNSYTTMVSDKYTIQIDILDSSNKNILNPNNLKGNPKGTFNSLGSKNTCRIKKTLPDVDNLKRYILHDKSTGVDFLTTTKDFNKYNIYTRAPISVIDDSLNKSIRLLLIIMIPVSILAILITYLFSEKFTRPIKLITNKAIDLQSLKFTSPLEIQSNDEIEELAKSFNYLSSKIESSLNELTRKNSSLKHYIKKEKENESHRREFVSSVSHELKTPITVISGYAQALKTKIVTTDKDKDFYLNVICDEAHRMEVIVNDLLNLNKLQDKSFAIDLNPLDISLLINSIINKLKFQFKELSINLITNIESLYVLGDSIRLEQAIVNYINNALHHVDENKIISITVTSINSNAIISVFNSGEHISEDCLNSIWLGFVRLDKTRNFKDNRLGLGLAVVDQIITLHNGKRGVTNKAYLSFKGVEFYISLPLIK